jgi:hypothetical protein
MEIKKEIRNYLNRRKFKAKMICVNREIQMRRMLLKFKDAIPC